jgi:hypothetical protein
MLDCKTTVSIAEPCVCTAAGLTGWAGLEKNWSTGEQVDDQSGLG